MALMDLVEQVAEGPEVALSVTQRGADLIAWYERRGYRRLAEFHWPEARDPSWIMVKRLPPESDNGDPLRSLSHREL